MESIDFRVRVNCITFNHSAFIIDAMNGFCMQNTSFPFVCDIVDDFSTDGEQEVIRQYLNDNFDFSLNSIAYEEETSDYSLVFAQHKTNKNCFFTVLFLKYNHYQLRKPKLAYLNKWQNLVKYVAYCEGDDYWTKRDKLQAQVEFLDNNPDVSLCHTAFSFYYQEEQRLYENKAIASRNVEIEKMTSNLVPFILMFNDYRIQTCSVLYKSSSYKKIECLEKQMAGKFLMGDTQMWCLLNSVGQIRFMNDNTCVYRVVNGSASHQINPLASSLFYLSSCEMRVYISRLLNLDKSYQTYFRKKLLNALISHKMLKADYRLTINPDFTLFERLKYSLYLSFLGRMLIQIKKRLNSI